MLHNNYKMVIPLCFIYINAIILFLYYNNKFQTIEEEEGDQR